MTTNDSVTGDGSPVDRLGGVRRRPDTCETIENELLCYLCHKMDIIAHDKLVKITGEFYTDEEIRTAKDIVFTRLATGKRNIGRKVTDKSFQNVGDILDVLHKVEPSKLPRFGAFDLNRLPPLEMNDIDVTSMYKDVKRLKEVWSSYTAPEVGNQIDIMQKEMCEMRSCMKAFSLQLSQVVDCVKPKVTYADAIRSPIKNQADSSMVPTPVMFSMSPLPGTPPRRVTSTAPPKQGKSMQSPRKPEKERQPEIRPNSKSDEPAGKDVEGGPMTLVQRKRRGRKDNVILGSSSKYKGNIKSRGRYVSLFVSRLDPGIEPMELNSYIRDNFHVELECTKLKTRYDTYSSFKVEGHCADPGIFLDPSKWPVDILVKKFFKPRS